MTIYGKKLLDELVRRRVVGTGAAYAVASFVTLQLGEILLPAYGIGPAGLRTLVAALLAGVPLVLAGSWVYDLSRPSLSRTPSIDEGAATATGYRAGSALLGALLLAAGLGWWLLNGADLGPLLDGLPAILASAAVLSVLAWQSLSAGGADAPAIQRPSIAVLPFACWGSDEDAYLGEALADEIRNQLQDVTGLDVAARISCADCETPPDARSLGRRLGVATLLEGSLLRHGRRTRVAAQLIDARTGFRIWSRTYPIDLEGPLAGLEQIAGSLVEEITRKPERRSLRAVG